jgi:hypothetical protein
MVLDAGSPFRERMRGFDPHDGANLSPTYRNPFDLIFQHAKTENWSEREDLDLRPPAPSRCPDSTDIAPLHWYQSRWENAEENSVTKLPTVRFS